MPQSWEHRHRYDSPWAGVVLAYSLRYPSPLTPHIVTVDVLSRDFDPKEGTLTTERIILKRGAASALPRWFPVKVLGRTESWVYEKSCIDLLRSSATVVTRNMDHRTVMDVQEDLHFHVDPADPQQSLVDASVLVTSSFGLPFLQSRIETFGLNRCKLSTERARSSLHTFIELLRNPSHRRHLLDGRPPPMSAMLPPALGESFSRWEETGSGFQGHGFDDQIRERYVPEHLEVPPERAQQLQAQQRLLDWARDRRKELSDRASASMKNVRTKWFGWRLQMREVIREEAVDHQRDQGQDTRPFLQPSPTNGSLGTESAVDAVSHPVSASSGRQDQQKSDEGGTPQGEARPASKQTRSWVWEWSRNS